MAVFFSIADSGHFGWRSLRSVGLSETLLGIDLNPRRTAADFSGVDLGVIAQQFQHLDWTPFLLAILVGGAIGFERELHGRPAGVRTHMMVCLSATIAIQASQSVPSALGETVVGNLVFDPNRLAAGIVTGIGFLGAGVIVKEGLNVRGLTTAASIWITASIGILIGMGFFYAAGLATLLALGTLSLFRWFESMLPSLSFGSLSVQTLRKSQLREDDILEIAHYHEINTTNRSYHQENDGKSMRYEMVLKTRNEANFRKLAETLSQMEEIAEFSVRPRSS